ncbi:MAG TPA: hypothetical protein VGF49_22720, partial [Candidatus Solibacter sp.]
GDLRVVLLSLNKPRTLLGYAGIQGALYRFDESPGGSHEVIAASCPALPEFESGRFQQLNPAAAIAVLELPKSNPKPPAVMVTVLGPRASAEPAGLLKRSCTEVERVTGTLSAVDPDVLVASLRRDDTRMRFYRHVEDLPGFSGVGIPAGAQPPVGTVPLPGVVNLTELDVADPAAKIEKGPPVRATMPAVRGGFGAQMPVHAAEVLAFPRWVRFRLRVVSGRVGLAAIGRDGAMVARSGLMLPSPEAVDVAIKTPTGAETVVLFNAEDAGGTQVEILDATAVAAPADGVAYRRLVEQEGAGLAVPGDLRPPAHSVRLEQVLKLSEVQPNSQAAKVEHVPQVRVTTPASHGAFAAYWPLHGADKAGDVAWVQLRLRVLSGRVGLAVVNGKGEILVRSTAPVPTTGEPVSVALKVPGLGRAANFVVFNENIASASQIEVLDAAVVVSK